MRKHPLTYQDKHGTETNYILSDGSSLTLF